MTRFVDLEVVAGPDKGMRYTIAAGSYRVLGRCGDCVTSTLQMNQDGDRDLDEEQQALVRGVVGTRSRAKKRGADILLGDDSVSRTHAMVFVDADSVSVADLMSTNGTRVNGDRVTGVQVSVGDVVHLGQTKFVICE